MISPRSIPLKYTGWKNQHSQVSSKPGRCLHVTEETVRYFDSNKWLWLVMTAVKRSGTTEEYSAFVIRKDSEGVFLYIYFKEKEEGLFYEWNINDDHCHCCAWWSISSLWSLSPEQIFCWLFCILVVAAFADVVAGTFNGFSVSEAGKVTKIAANGAVATTSMIFILEAVGLGMFLKYTKFNKWINTAVAIVLLVAAIALGLHFPMYVGLDAWHLIIFVYILIASVAPVWALLQPRDYLNSYLLIFMIVGAIVGVFVANPSCNLQAFTSFNVDGQYMFPILFVTIACGAVSGFHSLVSSGTASKQIKNEKNMLPVSFGAMLMESMLAVIALIAVASFAKGEAAAQGLTTQPQIFAGAIANFLSVIGLPHSLVFTLINLAVSAFALTSLDSVARVGRLSFQEFFLDDDVDQDNMSPFLKVVTNKYFATVITLVLAYFLTKVGYAEIWPLFGSANQLLSVLALVACAVFLKKTKRKGFMLWGPMVFMMAVTFTALGMTIVKLTKAFLTTGLDLGNTLQLIFAVLLLILGVLVAIQGVKKLLEKTDDKKATA